MVVLIKQLLSKYAYHKYFRTHFVNKKVAIGHRAKITYKVGLGDNKLTIGDRSLFFGSVHFESLNGNVKIGEKVYFGSNSHISSTSSVIIGNNVLISFNVWIFDNNAHSLCSSDRQEDIEQMYQNFSEKKTLEFNKRWTNVKQSKVIIGNNVWIGMNSVILPGSIIEDGAIIGAGSVVRGKVPKNAIVKTINKILIEE